MINLEFIEIYKQFIQTIWWVIKAFVIVHMCNTDIPIQAKITQYKKKKGKMPWPSHFDIIQHILSRNDSFRILNHTVKVQKTYMSVPSYYSH